MTISRNQVSIILLLLFLIICSTAFFATAGWAHAVVVLLAYAGLYAFYKRSALDRKSVGITRSNLLAGLQYGAVVCAAIFAILLAAYVIDSHVFHDPRYHVSLVSAFFFALMIEPIKVILFEELAFRGILLALMMRVFKNKWYAITLTSLAFGLWHILPSLHLEEPGSKLSAVLVSVVFTTLAGILLAVLRIRSNSLAAPILVHWFVNGMAIVLAAVSWR